MSSTDAARPGAAFGPEVYAARRERAAAHAREAGLTGLLVSPGPDLAYFTGYTPPETERLTLLAIPAEGTGTTGGASVVVPLLERGDLACACRRRTSSSYLIGSLLIAPPPPLSKQLLGSAGGLPQTRSV